MAEILITGGAGNFGRTLAGSLRPQGHGIRIFDLPNCNFEVFQGWGETQIYTGDILDGATLARAMQGVDLIFHLAAVLPPASEEDRERTFRVNVQGTRNLLESCASSGGQTADRFCLIRFGLWRYLRSPRAHRTGPSGQSQ